MSVAWPRFALAALVLLCGALATPPAAAVGTQRTFVSSTGNDANPCSLTAPCRAFSAAIAQTTAGGEVIVLDSAGYGSVTVAQTVSIIAPPGIYAGISVFAGQSGVTVNSPAAVVVLRGLTINGQGGDNGVRIDAATRVHIESCVISRVGFDGVLIAFVPGGVEVFVKDTIFRDNGNYAVYTFGSATISLDHVRIEKSGFNGFGSDPSASVRLTVANSTITRNNGHGLLLIAAGGANVDASVDATEIVDNADSGIHAQSFGGPITLAVSRSTLRGNGARGVYATASGGGNVAAAIQESTISGHAGASGLFADGTGVRMSAARNSVTGNNYGLAQQSGAVFQSLRDNVVTNNVPGGDIFGTITTLSGL